MTVPASYREPPAPVFLFDLDGTLIDSVYQHVIAWRGALSRLDIDLSVWRIHRRIGMSGGLFVSALLRETGRILSDDDIAMLQIWHGEEYLAQLKSAESRHYVCAYELATGYAVLGDKDEAMNWLQKGYRDHSSCMSNLKSDPRLDSLHSDRRFQELVRTLRLDG